MKSYAEKVFWIDAYFYKPERSLWQRIVYWYAHGPVDMWDGHVIIKIPNAGRVISISDETWPSGRTVRWRIDGTYGQDTFKMQEGVKFPSETLCTLKVQGVDSVINWVHISMKCEYL